MDVPLDFLVSESSDTLLLENYKNKGIVIFDGKNLWLAVDLYFGCDGKAYCTRKIELCMYPALPSNEKFDVMLVNKMGNKVALSSLHSVYIIDVPNVCWSGRLVTKSRLSEHLRSTYCCKSQCIRSSIGMENGANIIKIRWYWEEFDEYEYLICNTLALLHERNVVRIYDTDVSCALPKIILNFNALLGMDGSSNIRSIGLYNYIASFDFGPSFVSRLPNQDNKEIHLKTLFAVDSECGDLYIAFYSDEKQVLIYSYEHYFRVVQIQGPCSLMGSKYDSSFRGDALDLLFIHCIENPSLPVFSLISSDGRITHILVLLMQVKVLYFNCQLLYLLAIYNALVGFVEFILIIYDSFLMPCKPRVNVSHYLRKDAVQSGHYFVINGIDLYSVDIKGWTDSLSSMLQDANSEEGSFGEALEQASFSSKIYQIFRIFECADDAGLQDTVLAMTAAAVENQYPQTHNFFNGKNIVYIIITSSKQLLFRSNDSLFNECVLPNVSSEGDTQNYLMGESKEISYSQTMVPRLRLNSVSESQCIELACEVIETMIRNMVVTEMTFKEAQNIYNQRCENSEEIKDFKSIYREQLLQLMAGYVDLKNRVFKIRKVVFQLKQRNNEAKFHLLPKMFPVTDTEKILKDKLQTMLVETHGVAQQIPNLINEVAVKHRKLFGPARSFSASASAQKFMLSKNSKDIDKMVIWTKKLTEKFHAMEAKLVAGRIPIHSPNDAKKTDMTGKASSDPPNLALSITEEQK
ncbi:unnamed protein product [Thelazia callipaeda]|uniref:CPSF_A domain-containing protein n=1 Tax=Thelazia callipaeda TaxID=103827 RepID=A0A0N5CY45_THECL|nr:unnamed protein product [Thelazia callipaeda]